MIVGSGQVKVIIDLRLQRGLENEFLKEQPSSFRFKD